jgi:hypothetical protein
MEHRLIPEHFEEQLMLTMLILTAAMPGPSFPGEDHPVSAP